MAKDGRSAGIFAHGGNFWSTEVFRNDFVAAGILQVSV